MDASAQIFAPPPPGQFTTTRKALRINLDASRYGTFAEIGAGQEVARHFFQAGGASGTVAKSMSAYDMKFSDEIYGKAGRYVSRERLLQMLDHEYTLLLERLGPARGDNTSFFVFADTVAARSFKGTNECHGWMGIRYQLAPGGPAHDIIIHVRMWDKENAQQQDALGIIGVNLIFGAFNFSHQPETFINSLKDNLSPARIEVDMIEFDGPEHAGVDNRLLSLRLVEEELTNAVMFGPDHAVLQPSEALHKKAVLMERGSFRPLTRVELDMMRSAAAQFVQDPKLQGEEIVPLFELNLNLLRDPATGAVDPADFLARVETVNALGYRVLVSNYPEYYRLSAYFRRYTAKPIAITLCAASLVDVFNEKHYENLPGGILEAFGRLFRQDVRLYTYPLPGAAFPRRLAAVTGTPCNTPESQTPPYGDTLVTVSNLQVPNHLRHLYDHLLENHYFESIRGNDPALLPLCSRDAHACVRDRTPGWEQLVPEPVARLIAERDLWHG